MKKTIEFRKHPYMWKVEIEFGTFEEMVANMYRYQTWNGGQVFIGGSFNEKMNDSGRRAPLVEIAVEFDFDYFKEDENKKYQFFGVKSPKGISYSRWEGAYSYYRSLFDEEMGNGLFPVRADWDGKTYIERWKYKGKDKYGVPIPDKSYYELTDTFRY